MPLLLPPQIVNVEWDHVTQRIVLPADWRELSEEDKHKVPLIQIRGYLPREFEFLPDWAIWGMTFCPGFALMSDLTVATGSGARVKIVYFLTSGTTVTVPANWYSSGNTIECLGGGGNGIAGVHGDKGSAYGGRGGGGGGGGAYVKSSNVVLTPSAVVPIQVGIANGSATTGPTWLGSTSTIFAKQGVTGNAQTGGIGGTTDESIGDVKRAGGAGGNGALPNAYGGGGGGGGGAGYLTQNGGLGFTGAIRPGGAGGASGPTAAGAAGTIWTQTSPAATGGPGGGGGGGNGGLGNNGNGDAGGAGVAGGLYGAGGGGGGGGGCGETKFNSSGQITDNLPGGNGGAAGVGKQGIIVATNNSDL